MKGTVARGVDPAADRSRREALLADPKQRAENLMIVDLMRNDLARIADAGSVRVPALFTVETYPGFHALTSTVTGSVGRHVAFRDRLAALFPCGSVVGAPKIRAGEIIRALEPTPRGFYRLARRDWSRSRHALQRRDPDRDRRCRRARPVRRRRWYRRRLRNRVGIRGSPSERAGADRTRPRLRPDRDVSLVRTRHVRAPRPAS